MRLGWLVCVLLWPGLVHADVLGLAFDYDLDAQPRKRFVLRTRTVFEGQTYGSERSIDTLPPASCPPQTPQLVADTLCFSVCLGLGDYTLEVYAVDDTGRHSAFSNAVDVEVTDTSPCQPVIALPPLQPKAPPPTPTQKPTTTSPTVQSVAPSAALLAGAAAAIAAFPGGKVPNIAQMINFNCVSWKITGVCACGFPPHPCVSVEYWEPSKLVETVKQPGQTLLPVLGDLVSKALTAAGLPDFGGGAPASMAGLGAPNLHFNEVHVYNFPEFFGGPCTSCLPTPIPPVLHYASEIDPRWRLDTPTLRPADQLLHIGVWARLYPRGGKAFTSSEPVGSGVCAMRGMDIAFNPLDATIPPALHPILTPSLELSTCMQLAYPTQTPCFTSGTPPPLWESGTLSVRGTYIWIAWSKKSCCVELTNTTCGITLPALGRSGANGCIVPSTP